MISELIPQSGINLPDSFYLCQIPFPGIGPVHALKNPGGSALHRQMNIIADIFIARNGMQNLIRNIFWMRSGKTNS